jgi:hypothetical protein
MLGTLAMMDRSSRRGDSAAKCEGDTLVVETIGFNDK